MKSEYETWQDELNGLRTFNLAPVLCFAAAFFALGIWAFLTFGRPL